MCDLARGKGSPFDFNEHCSNNVKLQYMHLNEWVNDFEALYLAKLDLDVKIETAVIDQFCKKANASLLQT